MASTRRPCWLATDNRGARCGQRLEQVSPQPISSVRVYRTRAATNSRRRTDRVSAAEMNEERGLGQSAADVSLKSSVGGTTVRVKPQVGGCSR
jgi:hypothetical protein